MCESSGRGFRLPSCGVQVLEGALGSAWERALVGFLSPPRLEGRVGTRGSAASGARAALGDGRNPLQRVKVGESRAWGGGGGAAD